VCEHFQGNGLDKTVWIQEDAFKFRGLMAIFRLVMRGAFPKQTLSDMNHFKAFANGA